MRSSGAMLRFTPWQPERCLVPKTSTTSATLATDTPQSSIVRPMRQHGSCLAHRTWISRPKTKRSGAKKTSTGSAGTTRKKTASDAGVAATRTCPKSRAKKVVVYLSGSRLLVAGHRLDTRDMTKYKNACAYLLRPCMLRRGDRARWVGI